MAGGEWRYLVQRLTGDEAEPDYFLELDLPLKNVSLTDTVSGPIGLSGEIDIEIARLIGDDGMPLFLEWGSAIWAERDGHIRGGGILTHSGFSNNDWSLDCTGYGGYPAGQTYTDSWYGVEIDPLDVHRHIWEHLQSKRGGYLGMNVDQSVHTDRQVGVELVRVEFDPNHSSTVDERQEYESGPVKLNWYETDDLGSEIDDLAQTTPYDWYEHHHWNTAGDGINHYIDFGYPRVGSRRTDLRFMIGENVLVVPEVERDGDIYASQIIGLGAGTGRSMRRGFAATDTGRLRRVATVTNKSARTKRQIDAYAKRELVWRTSLDDISTVVVQNHPNAPIGSWMVGDEIRLVGDAGWVDVNNWFRITESTMSPDSENSATLSIQRTDRSYA